jgi:hypothetical protein
MFPRSTARTRLIPSIISALMIIGVVSIGPAGAAKSTKTKTTKEVSPAGDIPDNQAFVPYTPKSGGYTVSVPEGWARTESAGATSFTDKLNTIRLESGKVATAPTTASIVSVDLPVIRTTEPKVVGGKAASVNRKAGKAVLLTYRRDSATNAVTGKVAHEAVERYEFWRNGTQVTLTLSGPVGADNVDPWKIVTDSFVWA